MRLLITGLNGTLAPHLARVAKAAGAQVLPWPREVVDPADEAASALFLQRMKPDAIAHLGMGAEAWAGRLSAYAAIHHLGGQAGRGRKVTIPARPYLPINGSGQLQNGADQRIIDIAIESLKAGL